MDTRSGLDAIGVLHGTDKSSTHHDYLVFYERYLQRFQTAEITLLEIGVLGGASLAVWEEYFPNGKIIGADIDPTARRFVRPRVAIEIADQSNIEHLVKLGLKHGPFDVIIEDGSHLWDHQITSLKTLFPFLKEGGFYVVEDLQTNYGSLSDQYRGISSISCVEYLKKIVDLRVADDEIDISRVEDPFLRTYGRAMHSITFYRRACIIEKRMEHDVLSEPYILIESDARVIPLQLLAHFGGDGDIAHSGWIRSSRGQIQGFSVTSSGEIGLEVSYRARLASGVWTEWASDGKFVGTRGQGENLTGFGICLNGGAGREYSLTAIGDFVGESRPVVVSGGEDCVSSVGSRPLRGIQIILSPLESDVTASSQGNTSSQPQASDDDRRRSGIDYLSGTTEPDSAVSN